MIPLLEKALNRFGLFSEAQTERIAEAAVIRSRRRTVPLAPSSRSFFAAAQTGRLTADLPSGTLSANGMLYSDLEITRNRLRRLREWVYFKKAISILKTNVVGENGIGLKSMAIRDDGSPDKLDRQTIEDNWNLWCEKENCTVTRDMTLQEVKNLVIPTQGTDGELFIRIIRGFNNKFRFALQLFAPDHVDINLNHGLSGSRKVRMGIEYDEWGAPAAYYIRKLNPNDNFFGVGPYDNKWERVPVEDIVHPYVIDWLDQGRGYPWFAAAVPNGNMLRGYEEAELVGARGAAHNLFKITYSGDAEWQGEQSDDGTSAAIMDSEPGQGIQCQKGQDIDTLQFNRPNTNFDMFMKRVLRGLSAGLPGASYNILADDMESVNFSSARIGLMEPREVFRGLQRWMICDILKPIFNDWLEVQLAGGLMRLPLSKIEKFRNVRWCGRRWSYIEPEKEVDAAIKRINSGISSLGMELEALGVHDLEEHLDRLRDEQQAIKSRNLTLPEILEAAMPKAPAAKPPTQQAA